MEKETIGKCPICSNKITITKLHCEYCDTTIEGSFYLCKFCQLNSEEKNFLEIFIKNKGNLKEIEKEMGLSYPTIRNKLENIIESLGYKDESKSNKKDIASKLSSGEITTMEAIDLLKKDK
ncbi:hypothetical protein CLPU_23c00130 [Gottschalkia purinilytica]|uniref:DUF2089 domain-containing protein n=1 Tax=Gottschalkia purinilytica TaxID=1503 RepID=A0A0L0W779_GOTPU|nr:DUF2089 domain-containing protein [Gottschalkia purinilytica]KNF07130.1 hypothetical protein CLPU_23c00130 [Gottschalkia purinilytica]